MTVIRNEGTFLVRSPDGGWIGGVGFSHYRPWVFPLYAPSGRTVIEAFPHGHPWHNGIFSGQQQVEHADSLWNFWGIPLTRSDNDPMAVKPGRIVTRSEPAITCLRNGAIFTFDTRWVAPDGSPVLEERLEISFRAVNDATICDYIFHRKAAFGPVRFPVSKLGGIGVRIESRLIPPTGGEILADGGRQGNAGCVHHTPSTYVAWQAKIRGEWLGVAMLPLHLHAPYETRWFVRDFGLILLHPVGTHAIKLATNETWTLGLRVVAFDGALTVPRTAIWGSMEPASTCTS